MWSLRKFLFLINLFVLIIENPSFSSSLDIDFDTELMAHLEVSGLQEDTENPYVLSSTYQIYSVEGGIYISPETSFTSDESFFIPLTFNRNNLDHTRTSILDQALEMVRGMEPEIVSNEDKPVNRPRSCEGSSYRTPGLRAQLYLNTALQGADVAFTIMSTSKHEDVVEANPILRVLTDDGRFNTTSERLKLIAFVSGIQYGKIELLRDKKNRCPSRARFWTTVVLNIVSSWAIYNNMRLWLHP